jgi:hypothetical protein
MPRCFKDTEWMQYCLDIFTTLCFPPKDFLTTTRLGPGSFYCLESWHFECFERFRQAEAGSLDYARALLFPIFQELNECFRRASWFSPIYKVNWTVLSRVVKGFTTELEQACYLLASEAKTEIVSTSNDRSNLNKDSAFVRVSRTVLRAKQLLEERLNLPKRTARYSKIYTLIDEPSSDLWANQEQPRFHYACLSSPHQNSPMPFVDDHIPILRNANTQRYDT